MEEKKAATQTLIESIGQEKTVVDAAVESSRGDEEAAATLQVLMLRGRSVCFVTTSNFRAATISTDGMLIRDLLRAAHASLKPIPR